MISTCGNRDIVFVSVYGARRCGRHSPAKSSRPVDYALWWEVPSA